MALTTGERLGPYEIVGVLGHGAMGEVYRARDTRLGREVAVKVLPAAFANDADRLSRVEREARLISHVNHPNICTLFDIVEGQHAPVLIFELIEGETLQQRLLRGPMPLGDALRCASGIASALEAAHGKGIIHRDLKPSNIKLTATGAVKVLDFGVAKIARDSGSELGAPDLTLTLGGTKEGALVGTVAYVSPEQAMGDRVDGRSDIWAFGCLLYEMLTATRAFPGVAVADTLGAVMRGEPDWSALPADTSRELRTLLRRCLEKDRAKRLADIADARLEIEDLLAGRSMPAAKTAAATKTTVAPSSRARPGRFAIVAAFIAGVVFATFIAQLAFDRQPEAEPLDVEIAPPTAAAPAAASRGDWPPATPAPPVESPPPSSSATVTSRANTAAGIGDDRSPQRMPSALTVSTPALIALPDGLRWARAVDGGVPNTLLAMSPDGTLVVYSARAGDVPTLWLHSLKLNDTWQLLGTEGGISPFWSPDSASIGFFADRKLKRLDLDGLGTRSRDTRSSSLPVTLAEVRSQRGGTWGPDNTIVFAPFPGVLKRIPANGGEATSLTQLARGEPYHVRAQFFPGTRNFLYRVTSGNGRSNPYYVTSLDGGGRKLIGTFDSGNVIYSEGHLLFMQGNILMAQPFDVKALSITGPPKVIASGVLLSTGSPPVFGVFSASQTGTLVYLSQGGDVNDPITVRTNWANSPGER
jgi:hypothetical protein